MGLRAIWKKLHGYRPVIARYLLIIQHLADNNISTSHGVAVLFLAVCYFLQHATWERSARFR